MNKKLALSKILPYTLAISEVEIGAFLVVQSVAENEDLHLTLIAQQGMPSDIIRQLTSGELSEQLQQGDKQNAGMGIIQLNIIQTLLHKHNLRSLIGLPLQCNGYILGAIVLGTRQESEEVFSQHVRQQLATLAQLASVFLDHVRLQTDNQRMLQEAHERNSAPDAEPLDFESGPVDDLEHLLEAMMSAEEEVVNYNADLDLLNQLSGELAETLNLSRILQKAIDQTISAVEAETGWIYLYEDEQLVLYDHKGLSDQYVIGMKYLKPGNGVDGMAFSRNEAMSRDTLLFLSGESREIVKEEGIRNVSAVPLIVGDKPFGVLAVGKRSETQMWTNRDERMLTSISQRVAQAILNARMFTELQYKASDLETQNITLQRNATQLSYDFGVLKQQIGPKS